MSQAPDPDRAIERYQSLAAGYDASVMRTMRYMRRINAPYRYMTTFDGLRNPWRYLASFVPDLRIKLARRMAPTA
jgi:hypothetical protein